MEAFWDYSVWGFFNIFAVLLLSLLLANALNVPISVMETAGEGGPWGMALLAAYMIRKEECQTLEHYLETHVFANAQSTVLKPDESDLAGFNSYIRDYRQLLEVERKAVELI